MLWRWALRSAQHMAPDAITRNALLAACSRQGWRHAARLFKPELIACNALMAAVRWEDGLRLLGLLEDERLRPDMISYQQSLESCKSAVVTLQLLDRATRAATSGLKRG